ncbi:MAG TPA: sulfur carrier protein ThiS adenylyltransferase ThiF [Salinivirgaceae bacterium]|nr:sulfur carrier protein ThiS adenylyltransferase ThiF [Salinivirgaceae bacterium]HQA76161.1 sulfur carrier protein ThiS adenylyltransferase ThiF [Salinivirgaceae bacterium]
MFSIETIRRRLHDKKVGIAGSGGLGSNCAMALARVGIGHLVLTDLDIVEESDLAVQYYFQDQIGQKKVLALSDNVKKVNPQIKTETHDVKLDENSIVTIFRNCDVIVEAFSLVETKQMLVETVLLNFPEKYLIMSSGLAGWGDNNKISQASYEKLIICGDFMSGAKETLPPLAPRVGIVSNMQANAVLEILLNKNF